MLAIDPAAKCDIEVGNRLAREIKKGVGGGLIVEQDSGPRTLLLNGREIGPVSLTIVKSNDGWLATGAFDFNNVRLSKAGKLQPGGLRDATFDHDTLPQILGTP